MVKIGIIICYRNRTCTGNKCFMAVRERDGIFARYPKDEPIEVVGGIYLVGSWKGPSGEVVETFKGPEFPTAT